MKITEVIDDIDSDDSDNTPGPSPKNAIIKTPITDDTEQETQESQEEETVINNIEIVIDDISGN